MVESKWLGCPGWVDLGPSRSGGPSSLPERPESAQAVSKVGTKEITLGNAAEFAPYVLSFAATGSEKQK